MTVAIVGGSGLIGSALGQQLLDRGVSVLVCDLVPPKVAAAAFLSVDLMANEAEEVLRGGFEQHGIDTVVHLAARLDPPTPAERERMRRLHMHGTQAAARAALRAGASRFVLASSSVVYGARPDNPVPLTEDAPVRPDPGFAYAVDKAGQEQVAIAELQGTSCLLAVVRPAIVYGPDAKNYLTEIIRRAPLVFPAIDGCRPPLQFVHVDDAAAVFGALAHGPGRALVGAFHACPDDWLAFEDVAAAAHLRVVFVPSALLGPLLDVAARVLPPSLRAPSAMFPYLKYPFVLSAQKTRSQLGVRPRYSSADALSIMLRR